MKSIDEIMKEFEEKFFKGGLIPQMDRAMRDSLESFLRNALESRQLEELDEEKVADLIGENSEYNCKCEDDTCFRCAECMKIAKAIHQHFGAKKMYCQSSHRPY